MLAVALSILEDPVMRIISMDPRNFATTTGKPTLENPRDANVFAVCYARASALVCVATVFNKSNWISPYLCTIFFTMQKFLRTLSVRTIC